LITAADELVGGERHDLLAIVTFGPIVSPLKGVDLVVEGEQPAVGDGGAMGMARQIGQDRRRAREQALVVDDPFAFAQRLRGYCPAN
jgi:hypothetical protein